MLYHELLALSTSTLADTWSSQWPVSGHPQPLYSCPTSSYLSIIQVLHQCVIPCLPGFSRISFSICLFCCLQFYIRDPATAVFVCFKITLNIFVPVVFLISSYFIFLCDCNYLPLPLHTTNFKQKLHSVRTGHIVIYSEQWCPCAISHYQMYCMLLCGVVCRVLASVCHQSAVISIVAVLNHTQVEKLAYNKYLNEVMAVLMNDKDFASRVVEAGVAISDKVTTLSTVFVLNKTKLGTVNV